MQTEVGKIGISEIRLTEHSIVFRPASYVVGLEFTHSEEYVEALRVFVCVCVCVCVCVWRCGS